MAHLKISRKKVKALVKRLLAKTLTEDDYALLREIVKESMELGIIPKKTDD